MEKGEKHPQDSDKSGRSKKKPPGQFVSHELEEETARFIEEVKKLARRRKRVAAQPRRGLPPPRDRDDQRSRRR